MPPVANESRLGPLSCLNDYAKVVTDHLNGLFGYPRQRAQKGHAGMHRYAGLGAHLPISGSLNVALGFMANGATTAMT